MELKCLQCEHVFEGAISKDVLGWHSSCPKCGGSFDVEVPTGPIIMAFANPLVGTNDPCEPFRAKMPEMNIHSYYAFATREAFLETWQTIVEEPDGEWYWVMENGNVILDGACDPVDMDTFREVWDLNEDGMPKRMLSAAEMPFEGVQKAQRAYEKYRLEWMIEHGFTIPDLLQELEKMLVEDLDGSLVHTSLGNLFEDWEFGFGFADGSIWPCFDEFLCSDYPKILQMENGQEVRG